MQYAARLAALSSEVDDTLVALDQLDADSLEHAEFLATHHDQASDNHVCVHTSHIVTMYSVENSTAFDTILAWQCLKATFSAGRRVVSTRSEQFGIWGQYLAVLLCCTACYTEFSLGQERGHCISFA